MITKTGIIQSKEFNEEYSNFTLNGSAVLDGNMLNGLNGNTGSYLRVPLNVSPDGISLSFEGTLGQHHPNKTSAGIFRLVTDSSKSFVIYENQTGVFEVYINGSWNGGGYTMAESGTFKIELNLTDTYEVKYYENDTLQRTRTGSLPSDFTIINYFDFGGIYDRWYGSIDISTLCIKQNGVPIKALATSTPSISSYQTTAVEFYEI